MVDEIFGEYTLKCVKGMRVLNFVDIPLYDGFVLFKL
jgi:hypothetical protein